MNKKAKILIITSVGLVVIAVIVFLVFWLGGSDSTTENSNETTSPSSSLESSSTDNSESTPTENSTNNKVAIIEENESNNSEIVGGSKKQIKPVIVYVGIFGDQVEVSAYAPVVESNGNCTATIINNSSGAVVTKTVVANPDATTTQCSQIVVPISEVDSGLSSVTVTYASSS